MKKILLFLLILPGFCSAQKLPDYGFYKITVVTNNESIKAEILPVSGVPKMHPALFYYWYRENTISITQGGFSGKLLNGDYNEYYSNRNLKKQGAFKNGLKIGTWSSWSPDGVLEERCFWKNGVKTGKDFIYDSQGQIKRTDIYKNGVMRNDSSTFWNKINIFKHL